MLISIIINAHNEGTEVQKTIQNIKQTIQHDDLEFVIVDDASTDGCCDELSDANVVHNEKRLGVTRGRNIGAAISTGDVLVHTDGHIRLFNVGTTIESAIRIAIENQAIVVPAVGNFSDDKGTGCKSNRWYYSEIDYDTTGLLKIHRYSQRTLMPAQIVIGPSDGFYITPRNVFFNKLGMFSHYTGRFGWAEIGTAIRAWFTNVPIVSIPDFIVAHKFKKRFNYEVSQNRDIYVNQCQTHLICFDDETYKYNWEPKLRTRENYEEVKNLIFHEDALDSHYEFLQKYKVKSDSEFFDFFG